MDGELLAILAVMILGFGTVIFQNYKQHALTNSRMTELLAAASAAAEAKGNLQGRADATEVEADTLTDERQRVSANGKKESATRRRKLTALHKKKV